MKVITAAKEISIFRSGCTVRTYGQAEFDGQDVHLSIEGLSATAQPTSVRVLLGEGLTGSNVQVKYPTPEEEKKIFADVDRRIARVQAHISACDVQEQIWKGNTSFSDSQNFDLKMMQDYATALPEQLERIFAEKSELQDELEKLQEERRELEKKSACPCAELDVSCVKAGTYPVMMEYYEPNAYWEPAYEIRAEEEDQPLIVRLRANIRQTSGRDWENVSISLYTGNPSVSADIPELKVKRVQFEEVVRTRSMTRGKMMGAMPAMAAGGAMLMEDAALPNMALAEVQEPTAVLEEGETMNEYKLSGIWTIKSDSSEEHADLSVREIPCRYHVVSLPGISQNAFLAAEIKTADIQDIIDCEASLYLKGTYTGDICINADLNRELYDLSLGKDETIHVTRTQKRKYTSSVLLKGQLKTEYEYEIQVSSKKKKDCRVTILDQVPVSIEKSITVDTGTLSGAKKDEETGEIRWELELKPEEKKTLNLAYTVAWPKDRKITEVSVSRNAAGGYCHACGAKLNGSRFCPECGQPV